MKHRIRKLTSLLLSLSLISALTLPAAASNALGEDLFAKDTLLHQETQLSTNVFWSTTYSDLRTENLITYTPNKAVTPIGHLRRRADRPVPAWRTRPRCWKMTATG